MPRISLRAQTLRALADPSRWVETSLGTTISLVEMSENKRTSLTAGMPASRWSEGMA